MPSPLADDRAAGSGLGLGIVGVQPIVTWSARVSLARTALAGLTSISALGPAGREDPADESARPIRSPSPAESVDPVDPARP